MRKRTILAKLHDRYVNSGNKAPGWKALEKVGIDEDDIFDYWDFLTDALDEALGRKWRSAKPTVPELDDSEDDPPKGHHHFSVYVVELDDGVKQVGRFAEENPNMKKGCLYVGQTWHPPKKRLQQHLDGYKSCPLVRKYGRKLIRTLTKDGQFETRLAAMGEEERHAKELRKQGFGVWQR